MRVADARSKSKNYFLAVLNALLYVYDFKSWKQKKPFNVTSANLAEEKVKMTKNIDFYV